MTFDDLIKLYEDEKKKHGECAYKHISDIFKIVKEKHREFVLTNGVKDTEQAWKAFKGKNLEKLIQYIISDEVKKLNLNIINGNKLERAGKNLSKELSILKRNLCVDYGEFGLHLPDVDMIIYTPTTSKVLAVLSSKVSLRERIAQTGYWKLKLLESCITKHIKVFFITLDEDGTFSIKNPAKKGRAISEVDTDGCYVLTKNDIEQSTNVKMFSELIKDLKNIKY